jgi:formylglycine-generating enzyme required for sulfatase activity
VVVNGAGTSLTAVTPAGAVGLATVTVTTAGATATRAGAFRYFDSSWYTVITQAPNASVVKNTTAYANIAASGFPWRVRDIGTGIEMLLVPTGTFNMGCSAFDAYHCNFDESPRHQVTLTRAFYLGKTEVTQKQWQDKMGNNPSDFKGKSDSPSRPVETVSWNDIAGVAGFNSKTGLRLPTEAEWEYACRGGTTTAIHSTPDRPNGSNKIAQLGSIAWYGLSTHLGGRTHAVAGKAPNAFGFYDMSGNVSEWCNDWYDGQYSGLRVLRGGNYGDGANYCRSSDRNYIPPDTRNGNRGFRAARTP